jgi:hypothetical protein
MLQKIIFFFLCATISLIGFSQTQIPKILICSQLDSISDYVIWYAPTNGEINIDDKYLFNQEAFLTREFEKKLNPIGYEIITQEFPREFLGKFMIGLTKGLSNNATDKFGDWLAKNRLEQNIDYVIILRKLSLHPDVTNFSMIDSNLEGEEFGIVTYYGNKKKVIVYSMIEYLVFNTTELKRINYNVHEPFVKEWRKVINYKEKITKNGFLVDDKIPIIKSELDSLFLKHINKISDLIINKKNAL